MVIRIGSLILQEPNPLGAIVPHSVAMQRKISLLPGVNKYTLTTSLPRNVKPHNADNTKKILHYRSMSLQDHSLYAVYTSLHSQQGEPSAMDRSRTKTTILPLFYIGLFP